MFAEQQPLYKHKVYCSYNSDLFYSVKSAFSCLGSHCQQTLLYARLSLQLIIAIQLEIIDVVPKCSTEWDHFIKFHTISNTDRVVIIEQHFFGLI